ncbi:uncharacterized protein LOC142576093 isoform X1 [Dermacentor variabilis]|uniref:uncharacterized protein LOC142576093 isoform X1 n=1 Tax=Dermacentor variabilis TaxID=34621 RepID=UPI003F5BC13F
MAGGCRLRVEPVLDYPHPSIHGSRLRGPDTQVRRHTRTKQLGAQRQHQHRLADRSCRRLPHEACTADDVGFCGKPGDCRERHRLRLRWGHDGRLPAAWNLQCAPWIPKYRNTFLFLYAIRYWEYLMVITSTSLLRIYKRHEQLFPPGRKENSVIGIGNGLGMPTKDVIIGKYFKRYRGSGNGIYFTLGTLAGFAFPPTLHLLLQEYGFTGAFLITGGLMLNALPVCILFKVPPWEASKSARAKISPATAAADTPSDTEQQRGSAANPELSKRVATIKGTYKAVIEAGTSAVAELNCTTLKDVKLKPSNSTSILQSNEDIASYANGSLPDKQSDIICASTREISEARAPVVTNGTATTYEFPSFPEPTQFAPFSFGFLKRKQSGDGDTPSDSRLDGTDNVQNGGAVGTGNNSAVTPAWSLSEPEVIVVNGCSEAAPIDAAVKGLCRQTSTRPDALESTGDCRGSSHWSFLRAPVFYMVAVTYAFSVYTLLVLMILVDFAVEKGFTRHDGAVFLSVSAIGDACARLVAGALSDRAFCDRRVLMSASAMLTGALCVSLPTMRPDGYAVTALMCALLGWSNGTVVVLFGPLLADQLGVENLGLSSGVTRFVMGLAYLVCPKITGYYKDEIGSYDGLLQMISIGSFFVCLMWTTDFIYRLVKRHRKSSAS